MSIKEITVDLDAPLSTWPVFYKDGLPFIYDDEPLFYNEEGERLGQHPRHSRLSIYLHDVLSVLFEDIVCAITFDLTFRDSIVFEEEAAADASSDRRRYVDITPDVSLVKAAEIPDKATYIVGQDGPPPNVVFEVGSPSTYTEDLGRKLRVYAEVVQAREYFAYDPTRRRLWKGPRLKAWRLVNKQYIELKPDEQGRVWSEELQSFLVEDGKWLRLLDEKGQQRPTLGERERARADLEQVKAEQERIKAEQAQALREQEQRRAEEAEARARQEQRRAEEAEARAEQERRRVEQLLARLKELDPEAEI